jgi:hypothetical protein
MHPIFRVPTPKRITSEKMLFASCDQFCFGQMPRWIGLRLERESLRRVRPPLRNDRGHNLIRGPGSVLRELADAQRLAIFESTSRKVDGRSQ